MQYKKRTIVVSQSRVREAEGRVARQREIVERLQNSRHPADDAASLLLVMEQSLLAMRRFLNTLERELEKSLGMAEKPLRTKVARRRAAITAEGIAQDVAKALREGGIALEGDVRRPAESLVSAEAGAPGKRLPH